MSNTLRPYDAAEHTTDALAAQIEAYTDTGGLLAGSLGRASVLGTVEFDERREHPLYKHEAGRQYARDLDYIGLLAPRSHGAFPLDITGFAGDDASLRREGPQGAWVLRHGPYGEKIATLDAEIMRPVKGETVYGIPVTTVSPAMQYRLATLLGQRPNDRLATRLLGQHLTPSDIAELHTSAFRPLDEVARRNRDAKKYGQTVLAAVRPLGGWLQGRQATKSAR